MRLSHCSGDVMYHRDVKTRQAAQKVVDIIEAAGARIELDRQQVPCRVGPQLFYIYIPPTLHDKWGRFDKSID